MNDDQALLAEVRVVHENILVDPTAEHGRKVLARKVLRILRCPEPVEEIVVDADLPKYMRVGSATRACSIDGCPGRHVAQGYCMRHYCRIIRRKNGIVEAPGDYNLNADKPLTEDEFCKLQDCRSQGFSAKDVAFELQKIIEVIRPAWEFESYSQYQKKSESLFNRKGSKT